MNPKVVYTFAVIIVIVGGLYFVNAGLKDNTPPVTEQINTNTPSETEEETETFNKTGIETMEICNANALCHQGAVTFEAGEVISFTASDGAELGVEFSACDLESCYVEDVYSREWDLIWIEPQVE